MKSSSLVPSNSDSNSHSNTDNNEDNNNDNNNVNINVVEEHNSNNNNSKTEEDSANEASSTAAEGTASTAAATVKLRCDFENATFPDVALDEEGNPIGVWSWPWNKMPLKSGSRCTARTFDGRGARCLRRVA